MWIVVTHEKVVPENTEPRVDGMPVGMSWEPRRYVGPFETKESAEACKDALDDGRYEVRQSYLVELEAWDEPTRIAEPWSPGGPR